MTNIPSVKADTPEETRARAEIMLNGLMEKNSGFNALRDPDGQYNLAGVQNVHMGAPLTGEYSMNQTKTNYGVGGTDLGVMITMGDTTYIAFGDTFLHENQTELWRNNVMAYTTDDDYTDGLLFDGMIMSNSKQQKLAKELFAGGKASGTEIAKIPTGGIAIGDTMYLSYMSVREWLPSDGAWTCNHGGVVRSTNNGKHWQYLRDLTWDEKSGFCQMYPVVHGEWVYIVGIGGGRFGKAKLMRVPVDSYENKDAYEYLTKVNEDGEAIALAKELGRYTCLCQGRGRSCQCLRHFASFRGRNVHDVQRIPAGVDHYLPERRRRHYSAHRKKSLGSLVECCQHCSPFRISHLLRRIHERALCLRGRKEDHVPDVHVGAGVQHSGYGDGACLQGGCGSIKA